MTSLPHLIGLVGVGKDLGGVAEDKDHNDAGQQGGHGRVSPVVGGDAVVQDCMSKTISE